MNKKTRFTKSEERRHTGTSVEIAWTNEQQADLKCLWRHMVATKIATMKQKNQETANNSPSYRCAAIKKIGPNSKNLETNWRQNYQPLQKKSSHNII